MKFLQDELDALEERQGRRSLRTISHSGGRRLTIDGRTFINFSSNNYLGLCRHPRVVEAAREALDRWGAGATASRLISGSIDLHEDMEKALADFLGRESALLFPTGYMANLGVVASLVGPGDAVLLDRLCHASLVDAARLSGARLFVYRHADLAEAEKALRRAAAYRRRLLVTESLFSMDGDFAPAAELAVAARRWGAMSLVDEAHAIGVWGEEGRGVAPAFDVLVGTLSKSFGSQGGFVAGSRLLIETLVNKARSFIFTTGLSPVCVAAARAALDLIRSEEAPRRRVRDLSKRLRAGFKSQGGDTRGSASQIVPLLLGEAGGALRCAARLRDAGIYAPAIRPPTVRAGECRIRFSVTADHRPEDIDRLLEVIHE